VLPEGETAGIGIGVSANGSSDGTSAALADSDEE